MPAWKNSGTRWGCHHRIKRTRQRHASRVGGHIHRRTDALGADDFHDATRVIASVMPTFLLGFFGFLFSTAQYARRHFSTICTTPERV